MARSFVAASSHYLQVDTPPVTGYPFTLGCWFWTTVNTADQCLIYLGDKDTTNHRHLIYLGAASNRINYLVQGGGSNNTAFADAAFSTSTWHMLVARGGSATSRQVFVDGVQIASNGTSTTPSGLDRYALGMQRHASPGIPFSGRIDRAFVYNVALTDAEIGALSRVGSPLLIRRPNLVDYRKLGYFDPEPNWVAPGNTMTVSGAARDYGTPGVWEQRWLRQPTWIAAAGGAVFTQDLSGSVGSSGAVPKQTNRLLAGVI